MCRRGGDARRADYGFTIARSRSRATPSETEEAKRSIDSRSGLIQMLVASRPEGYPRKPMIETGKRIQQLVVVLVEVTKYDKEGYLIQFYKGVLPCNTLAAMWSLTEAAFASAELSGLRCQVIAFDERIMRG